MRHGSESFFILGEGLVTTEVGGRHGEAPDPINESDPVDDQAPPIVDRGQFSSRPNQAPPFRFIRVGPKGTRSARASSASSAARWSPRAAATATSPPATPTSASSSTTT